MKCQNPPRHRKQTDESGEPPLQQELQRYRIDIAGVSETCFAEEGSLMEERGGYTFFWTGKPQAEDQIHGVEFTIRTTLLKSLPMPPVSTNKLLIELCVPNVKSRHLSIISGYVLILTKSDDAKRQFYQQLDVVIQATPKNDKSRQRQTEECVLPGLVPTYS